MVHACALMMQCVDVSMYIIKPVKCFLKPEKNVFVGKYGTIWMSYLEKNYPMRYVELHSAGELRQKAAEVNEEAMSVLNTMVQAYLKKHKPKNPNSTMETRRLREQARAIAEEFILEDIVCRFH